MILLDVVYTWRQKFVGLVELNKYGNLSNCIELQINLSFSLYAVLFTYYLITTSKVEIEFKREF